MLGHLTMKFRRVSDFEICQRDLTVKVINDTIRI